MDNTGITLYAFLDIRLPFTAWEVAIGRVQSPCEIEPFEFGVSLFYYKRIKAFAQNRSILFSQEFRMEKLRRHSFPSKVSRLRGLYFFETEDDARVAMNHWGWAELEPYLSKVTFFPTALSRHDSEWISNNFMSNPDEEWMRQYWTGATEGVRPIKEVLALGTGIVENKDLRIQAYKRVLEVWPTSTPLLAAACCAFAAGFRDVATSKPALTTKQGKIIGSFYIDMRQFDSNQAAIISAVKDCQERGEFPPIQLPADQTKFCTLPDMRSQRFELESAELAKELSKLINAT